MKKNKKTIIILLIILITIALISVITASFLKDKQKLSEDMEIIKNNYQELNENVSSYNTIRTNYNKLSKDFYYETYQEKHENYVKLLTNYNEVIKKIDKNIEEIDSRCEAIYKDISVNNICSSYKILYEKLINLYIVDLKTYNNKLKGYNENKNDTIEEFAMIHSEYIDYNKDNTYEGIDNNG